MEQKRVLSRSAKLQVKARKKKQHEMKNYRLKKKMEWEKNKVNLPEYSRRNTGKKALLKLNEECRHKTAMPKREL